MINGDPLAFGEFGKDQKDGDDLYNDPGYQRLKNGMGINENK
jgi:hypothetical protein